MHKFQVEAPLLVVLGVDDLRCPPTQGREFHRALKARGIPTRYSTLDLDARLQSIFKTVIYTGKIYQSQWYNFNIIPKNLFQNMY